MGMPTAKVLSQDIEARSQWKMHVHRMELDGVPVEIPRLERRVVGGPHRGRKVATVFVPEHYFKNSADYEAALARLLADAEDSFAKLLEGGDDRDANAAA